MNEYGYVAAFVVLWLLPRLVYDTVVLIRSRRRPLHERLMEDD